VLPTFIQEKQDLETGQFAELLLNEVLAWSGDGAQPRQQDDITMLVIDFHGMRP
jgi:hypothetical protein